LTTASAQGPVEGLYLLGPACRPHWWEHTAVPELRQQAARLAVRLLERRDLKASNVLPFARNFAMVLEHGADPGIATHAGTTPLMAAAGINWVVNQTFDKGPAALLEAVRLAFELGNDVNAVNSMGLSAVHGAANRGSDEIIEFLFKHGARLELPDNEGRTPLIWADGVFLATHPPLSKPATIALIERLLAQ
jgi:hypothetical protein